MVNEPNIRVVARKTELLIMNVMAANKLDGIDHTTSVRYNTNSVSITIWTPDTRKAYKILKMLYTWYYLEPQQSYVDRTAKGSFIRLTFKNDYLIDFWTGMPLVKVMDELDDEDKEYNQPFEEPEEDDVDDYSDPFVDESDEEDFDWDCDKCPSRFECGDYIPNYKK